ncbi:hypothetical protein PGTUg99_004513 [Puccinia graminis f. sp. tritici]|uniref:Uncharacterized protein n=1 Tax=Puccinia graminis f. sp. tritici TaxID=56615 RepID=A0A5B0S258_PUCGR|nr:hypothetical protein PGTUg99_004513 [Puccinia graminis f. sp. tritici]
MVLGLLPFANQRTWQPSHSPTQSLLDYSVQLWHPDISSKGYYHLPIKGPGNSGILTYLPKATTICQSKDLASHPTCPTQSLLDYSVQLWHPEISSKGYYHLPIKGPGNHPTCPTQSLLDYSVQLWHPDISSKGYYHLPIKGPGKLLPFANQRTWQAIPLAQPNHSWITLSNSGILKYLPKATTICQSKDLATIPLAQPNHSWITLSSSGILTYLPKATTICQSKDLASHPTCPTQSLLDYSVQLWHPEISSKGYYHLPIKGPGNHPTCPTQSLLDYSVQLWHPDISSKGYYHLPIKGPGK